MQPSKAPLPQFLCDLLAAPPRHGDGVHQWLYRVARQLHAHRSEREICELLTAATSCCGRDVPAREIEDAVRGAQATAWQPSRKGTSSAHLVAQPKWPAPDYDLIKEALQNGQSLEEMRCASPVPVDGLKTADVLPVLFPGNPLLTVGKSSREFYTRSLDDCLPWAHECSFIVPSVCTKHEGLTQRGKPSQHCKEMVGPRQYLVCETDFTREGESGELLAYARQEYGFDPHDVAASILNFLTQFLPRLALVVSSGGKSLHGFFNVSDMTSPEDPDGAQLYAFMQSAALIGCDHAGWNRSQFARMPGGTRHDADGNAVCPQTINFFNPNQCLTP